MTPAEVTLVHQRLIDALVRHFQKALMPDEEFIALVRVILSSGTSVLRDAEEGTKTIEAFEKEILQYSKAKWLEVCAKNIESDDDRDTELAAAAKEFDYMYKKGRKRRKMP